MIAGNWNLYGGIYRDVRLVVKNPVYIPYQGSYRHEGGTFITTPEVDSSTAKVRIQTYVKNESRKSRLCELKTQVMNPTGQEILTLESKMEIKADELYKFDQQSDQIFDPMLWHPKSPNVYQAISLLYIDGVLMDSLHSPFGFRWYRWDYETDNLHLNGQIVPIRGINRHQEYPWLGDAIPKWITKMDFLDMRHNLGFNFIRAAHYPNDPYVYDLVVDDICKLLEEADYNTLEYLSSNMHTIARNFYFVPGLHHSKMR